MKRKRLLRCKSVLVPIPVQAVGAHGEGSWQRACHGGGGASKEKKKAFCCYVSFFSFALGGGGGEV
jgi:hypothetical protein